MRRRNRFVAIVLIQNRFSKLTSLWDVLLEQEVQDRYNTANGYEYDASIIYGDTDSVMVKFGCPDLVTAMRLGAEAADLVSTKFIKPIKLEFEKVYYPYLLINKKRYAGLYWTKPEKYDKMDTKGIEVSLADSKLQVSH